MYSKIVNCCYLSFFIFELAWNLKDWKEVHCPGHSFENQSFYFNLHTFSQDVIIILVV